MSLILHFPVYQIAFNVYFVTLQPVRSLVRVADKATNYYWINTTTGTLFRLAGAYSRGFLDFTIRVSPRKSVGTLN